MKTKWKMENGRWKMEDEAGWTKTFSLVLTVLIALLPGQLLGSDPIPAAKQKKPIALIGGTVFTVSGAVIPKGTVVFDKGKITAVGTTVAIPADAERIDVTGKNVYPGLIDSYSIMGLTEIGSVRGTLDYNETGDINPNARVEVAVHPESELIPVARSGGITITGTAPQSGLISGTSAAIMMDGWTWEDLTLKAPLGLVVNWPAMTYTRSAFSQQTKEEWTKNRDTRLKALRDAFANARSYMVAKKAEQQKGIPYHDTDLRWEAMIPVLEGKVPVWVNANELAQIQAAITWTEQENVRLVIVGGRDSWRITSQLNSKKIPVILTDVLSSPQRRWENYDQIYATPAKLKEAGILFCISGDSDPSNARNLNHHAATAAAFGLAREDALKAVTLDAAKVLGIDSMVGSVESGKDATLIVVNGDILELSSVVEKVFIQGRTIDLRDMHKQLYDKYSEKYRQLKE
ncbi:MAG: amidohydrolase family protein [Bacteroidota bacterium]